MATRRRAACPHVPMRPTRATRATRLLRLDGLTRPEYQMTRPIRLTWIEENISMHSWHVVSSPSQQTRQHSGTHLPHHQPQAKLD